MNGRQIKKHLSRSLFCHGEKNGRKVYSYKTVSDDSITFVFTAEPKQKGCRAYSQKYIFEELRLYGYKAAYELISVF